MMRLINLRNYLVKNKLNDNKLNLICYHFQWEFNEENLLT